jgi:hypothetical protein
VCGYGGILVRNLENLSSQYNGSGTAQRFEIFEPALGPNSEGTPSNAPANTVEHSNLLHSTPYPNTAAPNQTPIECEAGKEGYQLSQTIGNVPGDQGTATEPAFQR